jgi:glutamine phosphoribosylpyrophosphate amidotransferase
MDRARFRTTSDTKALLHLCTHGAEMVRRLRGMFAFDVWDEERRRLFLARDPYGIKPLYTLFRALGPRRSGFSNIRAPGLAPISCAVADLGMRSSSVLRNRPQTDLRFTSAGGY